MATSRARLFRAIHPRLIRASRHRDVPGCLPDSSRPRIVCVMNRTFRSANKSETCDVRVDARHADAVAPQLRCGEPGGPRRPSSSRMKLSSAWRCAACHLTTAPSGPACREMVRRIPGAQAIEAKSRRTKVSRTRAYVLPRCPPPAAHPPCRGRQESSG